MRTIYSDFTIIIPTLNEARIIGGVVAGIVQLYPEISVVVADDDSVDGTADIVNKLSQKNKRVKLIVRKNKTRGLTASIIDALNEIKTKYFIVMDGDGQHPPEKVKEMVDDLRAGDHIVVACRTNVHGWALHRRLISLGASTLGKIFLTAQVAPLCGDILSGFFGMKTEFAKQVIQKNRARFVDGGYKFLYDFLKCLQKDTRIGESGYVFGMREGGTSKIGLGHYFLFVKSLLS